MVWAVELSKRAKKTLAKIDKVHAESIVCKLEELANTENPRNGSKALKGKWRGLYRHRIGDYRIIIDVFDNQLTVIVVELGHRRSIYR